MLPRGAIDLEYDRAPADAFLSDLARRQRFTAPTNGRVVSQAARTIALDQEARPQALWLVAWQPRSGTVPPEEDPPAPPGCGKDGSPLGGEEDS